MAGLINAFLGGAAPGVSEMGKQLVDYGMKENLMKAELDARTAMEERIAERNKTTESEQHARNRGEAVADQGTAQANAVELVKVRAKAEKSASEDHISLQPMGDGRIAKVNKKGDITGFMIDPDTNKPVIGKKDISESQLAMAKSYFDEAKAEFDPEKKVELERKGREFLTTSSKEPTPIPANHIAALKANPQLAAQFDEQYGKDASRQYLGAASQAPQPVKPAITAPKRSIQQVDAEIKPLQKAVEFMGGNTYENKARLAKLYAERQALMRDSEATTSKNPAILSISGR